MTVMPDWMIARDGFILPWSSGEKRAGTISYGVSSYGYDVRLARSFQIFTPVHEQGKGPGIIDPKNFDRSYLKSVVVCEEGEDYIVIPPNSFALGSTMETIEVPRSHIGVCVGKSTYARCGIIVNVTPLEPEWIGRVTIEISNTAPLPAKVYAGEGIAQILFLKGEEDCTISYKDKQGKYQDQKGLTFPRVDE